ncbi:MAG: S9 family peptidase [bacterium]|nr:S9 family peptidase [bacterium]
MTETRLDVACEAPVARRDPRTSEIHGETLVDPYHWLRERDDPEVQAYLEAENAYTASEMRRTEALQQELYRELVGRMREDDVTVPIRVDEYLYYSRTEKGQQYPIRCRKHGSSSAVEEVLLDLNALSTGKDYLALGAFAVSPDHRLLAYSLNDDGSESFTLRVLDLERREHIGEAIESTSPSVAWAADSQTFFYVVRDSTRRPYKAYRQVAGRPAAEGELVFHEPDERFFVSLFKTRSREFLGLSVESNSTTEIHVLDAERPAGGFRLLIERRQGVELQIDHHGDSFYVLTNLDAVNFKLMRMPVEGGDPRHWREILGHRDDVQLVTVDCFSGQLAVQVRSRGLRNVWILDLETEERHEIAFDESVYTVAIGDNPELETGNLRLVYSSPVTPRSVIRYDMATRRSELLKRTEVLGGYDSARFVARRIHARAADGTRVPISLLHAREIELDGSHPCLLTAYGSYGFSNEPRFVPSRVSLLERGFVIAIAHVRGGGELGRPWYEDGKLLRKKNTFADFIAAAERLVEAGYTSSARLAIRGGSAGGLLIGAVLNQRPELFAAAIADVPFVDLMNTMLDPTIPLTVIEFEEWGDPRDPEYFHYMRDYSPYDNVSASRYPHLLINAGLNDPRVQYWEPAKWAARLRALKKGQGRLLLRVRMGSGHSGASGRYDSLREEAFRQAFLLECLT